MNMRSFSFAIVAVGVLALGAACGDDDNASNTATPAKAATTAVASPATATTATAKPSATSPASPSASATAEGTVDPLGGGQTTPWNVKPPKEPVAGISTVKALRMGVHPEQGGWERIVFEFDGDAWPPATVQYVEQAVSCGSGQPLQGLKGGAILQVAFISAQAHDNAGKATIANAITGPGTTVTNGVSACDFEGHVTWDFALTGKQNFKVSTLNNPPRVVIDVKQ